MQISSSTPLIDTDAGIWLGEYLVTSLSRLSSYIDVNSLIANLAVICFGVFDAVLVVDVTITVTFSPKQAPFWAVYISFDHSCFFSFFAGINWFLRWSQWLIPICSANWNRTGERNTWVAEYSVDNCIVSTVLNSNHNNSMRPEWNFEMQQRNSERRARIDRKLINPSTISMHYS